MSRPCLLSAIQPIKGALPIAIKAREEGFDGLIVPSQNAREAAVVNNLSVYGVNNIQEVIEFINGKRELTPTIVNTREKFYACQSDFEYDFAETNRIIDTESIVAAVFRKKKMGILKNEPILKSNNQKNLDYIKVGRYIEKLGGLNEPGTNQKFIKL